MTAFVSADDVTVRDANDRDIGRIVELLDLGSLAEGKEDPLDLAPYRGSSGRDQAAAGWGAGRRVGRTAWSASAS